MNKKTLIAIAMVLGMFFVMSSAQAADNPFASAMTPSMKYAENDKKCGGEKKAEGEKKCGGEKAAEGEKKCGGEKKQEMKKEGEMKCGAPK